MGPAVEDFLDRRSPRARLQRFESERDRAVRVEADREDRVVIVFGEESAEDLFLEEESAGGSEDLVHSGVARDDRPGEISDSPPLGTRSLPPRPLPPRTADPERLQRALELLGPGRSESRLGPYRVLTDDPQSPAFTGLAAILRELDDTFAERYRLRPLGTPAETIVVFEKRDDYLRFRDDWDELRGHPATGHAGSGLVSTFTEGRDPKEVRSTLIHEVTHLLNRRSIGPALPAWLDEGIAGDLGVSRYDGGRLVAGSIDEIRRDFKGGFELRGGSAALSRLAASDGERRGLPALLEFDVLRSRDIGLFYGESLFFVRCLLADACAQGSSSAFLGFLDDVARGGRADSEALRRSLARPWDDVERDFEAFVATQAREFGLSDEALR